MQNRWNDTEYRQYLAALADVCDPATADCLYSSRLLGAEPALVLHGGGNTSIKTTATDLTGDTREVIRVKASGHSLAGLELTGLPELDLSYLRRLRVLSELSDDAMINQLRTHLLDHTAPTPSIEAFMHAFLPHRFVYHTHADAVLALTNRTDGEHAVRKALGDEVPVVPYVRAGFGLALAVITAYEQHPAARGLVLMHHGLVTWGDNARDAYNTMIELVTRAEEWLSRQPVQRTSGASGAEIDLALNRLTTVAPVVRGLLGQDPPMVLRALITPESLAFVDAPDARALAVTPPLTPDDLIRTRRLPLWIDHPNYDDPQVLRQQLETALSDYAASHREWMARWSGHSNDDVQTDPLPRVIMMPGLGVLCAGEDTQAADITRDITARTITVKSTVAASGQYAGLSDDHLYAMEYNIWQQAKRHQPSGAPLRGRVAFVTGAAGAIGAGICRGLLQAGCHVAVTDLPGPNLESLAGELGTRFGERVIGVPMDVTQSDSVLNGIDQIVRTWGGVDIAVINAGIAHVSSLKEMDLTAFQRLERVNVEGTLLVLKHMAALLERQAMGGDIVLISTKNVFAPGATFGAYSATKAGAHQLARIASLELAPLGVRVNMVAPDAVFSDGARKSGLWQEVGPGRMKARGLDEQGLEEYYRNRNLLKARVTADHVANAVLFFVTRQTPTTGATIPVDGGLPDAAPR